MYLELFLEWGGSKRGNKYHIDGMQVKVEVTTRSALSRFGFKTCECCRQQFEQSSILDVVRSVKWSLGFNLRTLVSLGVRNTLGSAMAKVRPLFMTWYRWYARRACAMSKYCARM